MSSDVRRDLAAWFGDGVRPRAAPMVLGISESDVPAAGEVLLVTGGSGAGKSTVLREVAWWAGVRGWEVRWVGTEKLGRGRVAELFPGAGAAEVLGALGRVGLAEAGLLFRRARDLSEGERYRLRVARRLWEVGRGSGVRGVLLVMDEFAASLDPVTAMGVAGAVGRAVRRDSGKLRVAAAVGTWRGELGAMLRPDRWLRADYGRVAEVLGRAV